jgi:hypothetical protein
MRMIIENYLYLFRVFLKFFNNEIEISIRFRDETNVLRLKSNIYDLSRRDR